MNTLLCPAGTATDETFAIGLTAPCSVNLVDYDVAISILLIIRVITWALSWHDWLVKKRKYAPTRQRMKAGGDYRERRKWEQRYPIVPMISTTLLVLWLIMFLLVRFNFSSGRNGVSMLFWSLTFNMFAAYSLLFQRRVIRLGKRIIPISKAKLDKLNEMDSNATPTASSAVAVSRAASSGTGNDRMDQLQYMDHTLGGILTVQLLCILGQTICGCILGLVFPSESVYLQIAFSLEGVFIFLNGFALFYQMTRVSSCVKESTMDPHTKSKVLNKIQSQQMHFTLISSSSSAINSLIAAQVIPAVWYIMLYWIIVETSVSSFAVIEMLGRICFRRRRGGDGSGSRKDHLAVATGGRIDDEGNTITATRGNGAIGKTEFTSVARTAADTQTEEPVDY